MKPEEPFNIFLTTDIQFKQAGARMMASTDPWIRLEMKYEPCLVAFEGASKEIYMAEYTNTIAGFAIIQTGGSFKGYIQTILIREEFRGKGLGRRLIDFCEKRILKFSPNIFICVSSFNQGALKLYKQLGFKQVGELDNFLKAGYSELLLRKSVGPILGYKIDK